jgi:hypothetical protein
VDLYAHGYVDSRYMEWLQDMDKWNGNQRHAAANLTLGYVTTDVCSPDCCHPLWTTDRILNVSSLLCSPVQESECKGNLTDLRRELYLSLAKGNPK